MIASNLDKKKTVLIMIGVMAGILLASLDSTIVATAMPSIISSLKGFDYYAWPFTAFLLCMTISMPLFGKLADTYGFKPIYVFGIIIFLAGSSLCGLAQNMLQLIVFRGLQGIGGAILVSNSLAIIGILFPPEQRAKYLGIGASAGALASIVGPSLGGYITDNWSWRWIFYINIPVGIITLAIILAVLPAHKAVQERKRIDYLGAVTLVIGLIPMLLAFTWGGKDYAWNSAVIICMFAFSLVMLTAFVFIERKAADPIIPMSLFQNSIFNLSAIEIFLISGIMMGAIAFLPLFIQGVIGSSASKSGAILTPFMISMIVGSILGGIIVSKIHKFKVQILIGLVIMGMSVVLLSSMGLTTVNSTVILYMIIMGFGTGIVFPIFNTVAQNAFPENKLGVVTSSIQFFKSMGQTIASSVLGTVLSNYMKSGLQKVDTGNLPDKVAVLLKNPNTLSNADAIKSIKAQIPQNMISVFANVMVQLRQVLSNSIHHIFVICIIIAAVALFIALFIKEIPLSKAPDKESSGV